ncbi:hypothetical protein Vretimale_70, partial [Volvox reticuliferus]
AASAVADAAIEAASRAVEASSGGAPTGPAPKDLMAAVSNATAEAARSAVEDIADSTAAALTAAVEAATETTTETEVADLTQATAAIGQESGPADLAPITMVAPKTVSAVDEVAAEDAPDGARALDSPEEQRPAAKQDIEKQEGDEIAPVRADEVGEADNKAVAGPAEMDGAAADARTAAPAEAAEASSPSLTPLTAVAPDASSELLFQIDQVLAEEGMSTDEPPTEAATKIVPDPWAEPVSDMQVVVDDSDVSAPAPELDGADSTAASAAIAAASIAQASTAIPVGADSSGAAEVVVDLPFFEASAAADVTPPPPMQPVPEPEVAAASVAAVDLQLLPTPLSDVLEVLSGPLGVDSGVTDKLLDRIRVINKLLEEEQQRAELAAAIAAPPQPVVQAMATAAAPLQSANDAAAIPVQEMEASVVSSSVEEKRTEDEDAFKANSAGPDEPTPLMSSINSNTEPPLASQFVQQSPGTTMPPLPPPEEVEEEEEESTAIGPVEAVRSSPGVDAAPTVAEAPAATVSEPLTLDGLREKLLDMVYGTARGVSTTAEQRTAIDEVVTALEARNPNTAPTDAVLALGGRWKLVYTSNVATLMLLGALDGMPLVDVGDVVQIIDPEGLTATNKIDLAVPLLVSLRAEAGLEVRSPRQFKVRLTRVGLDTYVATPQLLAALEVPPSITVLGATLDLTPLKKLLEPINSGLEAAQDIVNRAVAPEVDVDSVPVPPGLTRGSVVSATSLWMLTTYLDDTLRISRDDEGRVFVMLKDVGICP